MNNLTTKLLTCVGLLFSILITGTLAYADILVANGNKIILVADDAESVFINQPARALFYEETSQKLYFATSTGIFRADRDGKNVTTIIANTGSLIGDLVVDTSNNKIIWTETNETRLRYANLDGSNINVLVNGTSLPSGLIISKENGKLYWSGAGTIESANLNGSGHTEVYLDLDNFGILTGLTLSGSSIFFTDSTANRIMAVDIDGSNIRTLHSGLSSLKAIDYDPVQQKLFFIGEANSSRLSSINTDGSSKSLFYAINGLNIIANFYINPGSETLPIEKPSTPVSEPNTTPAPEIRPPHTKMYMTIRNSKDVRKSRVIWTNYYREFNTISQPYDYINPQGIGYSKKQNSLYVIDRKGNLTTSLYRSDIDGKNKTRMFAAIYHYVSMFVDDPSSRVFLAQAKDDFATYDLINQKLRRLYNNKGNNGRGFGKIGDKLYWQNGKNMLETSSKYNLKWAPSVKVYGQGFATLQAITPILDNKGSLELSRDSNGIDTIYSLYNGEFVKELDYIYFGNRAYNYQHMAFQHLDPKTFNIPYALYLASGNKVDLMVFLPQPRIIPFLRLPEEETVTGMVEVPVDGSAQPAEGVGKGTIQGNVKFVDFVGTQSSNNNPYNGIQVHLTKVNDTNSSRSKGITQSTLRTTPDNNGNYSFDNLQEDATYKLSFFRPDLSFSAVEINVQPGTAIPVILAAQEGFSQYECSLSKPSKVLERSDTLNSNIVNLVINSSTKRYKKVSQTQKKNLKKLNKRLNANLNSLLESSRQLPSIRLICESEQTECTPSNKTAVSNSYKRKSNNLIKNAKLMVRAAFGNGSSSQKILGRINKTSANLKRIMKKLPTRTFECPNDLDTEKPAE
jgi:hypothetical protein